MHPVDTVHPERRETGIGIRRPLSVSVAGWLLVCLAALFLLGLTFVCLALLSYPQTMEPEDRAFQTELFAVFIVAPIAVVGFPLTGLALAVGVGMLKGRNWARLLFLIGAPIACLAWAVMTSRFLPPPAGNLTIVELLSAAFFYVLIAFLLLRPAAREFFGRGKGLTPHNVSGTRTSND